MNIYRYRYIYICIIYMYTYVLFWLAVCFGAPIW